MARIIRMQAYKDWKDGLITTEELLKGKVFREPQHLRDMWDKILARATGDWSKVKHHWLCACDKCCPTMDDKYRKLNMMSEQQKVREHQPECCCDDCLNALETEFLMQHEFKNLAPSDCEPE